ncbi:hypothetical protein NMY22_g10961 [Coprinellus aureogranulatus]|nr:hypothetical protein NMY22_g10961 [Coprinellus aureogranulatus]
MDESASQEWSQKCVCGKRFYQPNSYTHHIHGCASYKRGVGSSLESARARWATKTAKPKKGKEAIASWYHQKDLDVDHDISRPVAGPSRLQPAPREESPPPGPEGRGFRVIKPVVRYGSDFEATSTMPFHFVPDSPPRSSLVLPTDMETPSTPLGSAESSSTSDERARRSILDNDAWRNTKKNEFGLWKRYWTLEPRPHNPEDAISPRDIIDNDDTEEGQKGRSSGSLTVQRAHQSCYHPFPNLSSYLLGQWFWEDRPKSRQSLQQLVEIITCESFYPQDLLSTNWKNINLSLSSSEFEDSENTWVEDGSSWKTTPVTIDVPFNSNCPTPGSHPFTVEGFRFRPLISVIRAKLQDTGKSEHFHFVPHELRWQPPGRSSESSIYGELYQSQAFLDAYREIQSLPPEPSEDGLPRYVVGLMFASDQTMLASFGGAKLWPLYMLYGNESKYRRSKVSLGLFEEIAYFQNLPDSFADWYVSLSGKKRVTATLATHVHRELFHEQWRLLLDDEFLHAYRHGLVVDCSDGVRRRFYPRIMTYSADYPERQVNTFSRPGQKPCCKCLVSLDDTPLLGQPDDRHIRNTGRRLDDQSRQSKIKEARDLIYRRKHLAVNSKPVEKILKPSSLVPTHNAFSELLLADGFNVYDMAVVDILHEVEIGVWKSLFIHLLRILEVADPALIHVLDRRYRQVPTFGRDTIRRFPSRVSLLKQMAARNYEDLLRCAVPVFEGLFPGDHDQRVQNLLYTLGHWHGLAKCWMHSDFSLEILDQWTTFLGEEARTFVQLTCAEFETQELKREFEARKRSQARKSKSKRPTSQKDVPPGSVVGAATEGSVLTPAEGSGATPTHGKKGSKPRQGKNTEDSLVGSYPSGEMDPYIGSGAPLTYTSTEIELGNTHDMAEQEGHQPRTWNINTPKFHALGDVVPCIRRFGTTDSYSTQLSESFHRVSKARYKKTNKKDIHRQLTRLQARQARLKKLRRQIDPSDEELTGPADYVHREPGSRWYFIGKSQNHPVNLSHFIRVHADDWAVKGFLPNLKSHIFPRIINQLLQEARMDLDLYGHNVPTLLALSRSLTTQDLRDIHFHSDRIYRHSLFKIRYSSYDCRADHDTFNASTSRRDFMCLLDPTEPRVGSSSGDDRDLYRYGRILGVFHANVIYTGPGALDTARRRIDFLWVRWFVPKGRSYPWSARRHDVVSLARAGSLGACDFLDPTVILRAAHIVPRFASGPIHDEKSENVGRHARLFSTCAQDRSDWKEYLVNRFADRDMVMRFHPGLSPGHNDARPTASVPHEVSPMEWEPEVPRTQVGTDTDMADDLSTDSDDPAYDALPLSTRPSDDESLDDELEGMISDVPEPDSDPENLDTAFF